MRILQISPFIPYPPTNGGFLSVLGILKGLSNRGHKIDFVCYRKHADYQSSYNELKKYCEPHILDVQTDNNIFDAFLNFFSSVPYNASKYQRKELLEFLKDFFAQNNVDIVQIEHLHMGWVISELRKLTNAPIVLRQQNVETMIMYRFAQKQKNPILKYYALLQYKKFIKFEPGICRQFDLNIMISPTDEKRIKEFDASIKATTIPAGVEDELLKYNSQIKEPFSLAHIGHLDWYPNYDSLTWFIKEIFPKVLEKFPLAKLYIYGGGKTKNFTPPNELKENIEVVGFVENIWEEIITKSVAIVPLRIGSGIRIKILELLAVGIPIVTTSVGKEGIDVKDYEHLLIADDEINFANKINLIFKNKIDS